MEPGIEDILAPQLIEVRAQMTVLNNAVGQDDHFEGWEETVLAVGELATFVEDLEERVREEYRKREDSA